MNDIVGILWYKDEEIFNKALSIFTDSENMPNTYQTWQAIVSKELEEIKNARNIALRVDIDPATFVDWCWNHSFRPDSKGRIAFVKHFELEYEKTGKGIIIE